MTKDQLKELKLLVQDYQRMKQGDYAWISKEEFDKKFGHGNFINLLVQYFECNEGLIKWQGDDLEECLENVKATHGKVNFIPEGEL